MVVQGSIGLLHLADSYTVRTHKANKLNLFSRLI